MFTDAHVAEEGFLEFINNMLTTGMVPALYEQDAEDSDAEETDAEETDSGKPESNNIVASMYKDNPQAGVDRANDKVQKWENIFLF